jgi:hypothetical protein
VTNDHRENCELENSEMLLLKDCGHKAGYSSWDHLLDDEPLKDLIGTTGRSVGELRKKVEDKSFKTQDKRACSGHVWLEVQFADGTTKTV